MRETKGESYQAFQKRVQANPPFFRPLSPHLSIFRPFLCTFLSITHRAAQVFLAAFGALLTLLLILSPASVAHGLHGFWGTVFGGIGALALLYYIAGHIRHALLPFVLPFGARGIFWIGIFQLAFFALSALGLFWALG